MTTLSAALIGNGEIIDHQRLKEQLSHFELIIAVDGGLKHCHKMGIRPHIIVGDLDSIPHDLLDHYPETEVVQFPQDKDLTDMELGVNIALSHNPGTITLFGALGNRTDHSLSNLYMARKHKNVVRFVSDFEELFFINGSQTVNTSPGQVVSLMPLGNPVFDVKTEGLKWELEHATIDESFVSQSNVCLNNHFTVSCRGDLLCSLLLKR